VFCTAPANLHDRESSAELLRAAEHFAARRPVPLDALAGAGRTRVPATAEQLRRLEGLHSVRAPRPASDAVRRSKPPGGRRSRWPVAARFTREGLACRPGCQAHGRRLLSSTAMTRRAAAGARAEPSCYFPACSNL